MTRRRFTDRRYRVGREFCGAARPRHVARFCGEWLGQAKSRREAWHLVEAHQAVRAAEIAQLGQERRP